jgi:hypothetical protein
VVVVVVVVVVTGTQGRVSTGARVVVVVVVVVEVVGGAAVVLLVVVDSGTVVLLEVVESEVGGGEPALARTPDVNTGATASRVANTARAADEERRDVDIARSRRARGRRPPHDKLSVAPREGLTYSTRS